MRVLWLLGSEILELLGLDILLFLIMPIMQVFRLTEHVFRLLVDLRSKRNVFCFFQILSLLLLNHFLISFCLERVRSFDLISR